MTPPLYDESVPVCLHYLDRAGALVMRAAADPDLLQGRLAPDMFSAAQQFASAAGFALRACCPLAGQPVPDVPQLDMDVPGLRKRIGIARQALLDLKPQAFEGAETRRIAHRAGFADLQQEGAAYLRLFALPNFFFHLTIGFAILRQGGLEIGKADFDGLHDYPQGFRF